MQATFNRLGVSTALLAVSIAPAFAGGASGSSDSEFFIMTAVVRLLGKLAGLL